MTLTWAIISQKLRRFISDVATKPRIAEESLMDFWIAGQEDLVTYVSRAGTFDIVTGLAAFDLPDDLYRIAAVRGQNGRTMLALDAYSEDSEDRVWTGTYWFIQDNILTFTQALNAPARVYYQRYYPAPTSGESIILIPRWAIQALTYFVGGATVEQQAIADTQLRRWSTKTDGGIPTSNPFTPIAKYMMGRYLEVVLAKVGDEQAGRRTWHSSYR